MIPKIDVEQYTNKANRPFVYSVEYFKKQSAKSKILIVTDDYLYPQLAMTLALSNNPNIIIKEFKQTFDLLVPSLYRYTATMPTYLVTIKPDKFIMPKKYKIKLAMPEIIWNTNKYMVYRVVGK